MHLNKTAQALVNILEKESEKLIPKIGTLKNYRILK